MQAAQGRVDVLAVAADGFFFLVGPDDRPSAWYRPLSYGVSLPLEAWLQVRKRALSRNEIQELAHMPASVRTEAVEILMVPKGDSVELFGPGCGKSMCFPCETVVITVAKLVRYPTGPTTLSEVEKWITELRQSGVTAFSPRFDALPAAAS